MILDRNGDGVMNDGTKVFGDSAVLANGNKAKHGYEALADLDSDEISEQGELFALDELGIIALNTDYTDTKKTYQETINSSKLVVLKKLMVQQLRWVM